MKKPDKAIHFPPHNDPEAVRRFEEETGAIQIVVVTDPEMYRLLDGLLSDAVESCIGPSPLGADVAYDLMKARIAALNEGHQEKIPLPSFGAFKLRLTSDHRGIRSPRAPSAQEVQRRTRDHAAELRKRAFWFEACGLFIEMRAAGLRIEGRLPRLDDGSLQKILPALNRAVGGQKEGFDPPSTRWFRRQVNRMQSDF